MKFRERFYHAGASGLASDDWHDISDDMPHARGNPPHFSSGAGRAAGKVPSCAPVATLEEDDLHGADTTGEDRARDVRGRALSVLQTWRMRKPPPLANSPTGSWCLPRCSSLPWITVCTEETSDREITSPGGTLHIRAVCPLAVGERTR